MTELPYKNYETSKLWNIVSKSLDNLIENQDIELKTKKELVVGYICKEIENKLKRTAD